MMCLRNELNNLLMQKGDDDLKRYDELYEALKKDTESQEFLKKIPKALRDVEVPVLFKKGTTVIIKDDRTSCAYFMLAGALNVQTEFMDGNEYRFSIMESPSVIADLEVLSGTFINAVTVKAEQDALALQVPLDDFVKELRTNIDFLYLVAEQLARKMFVSSYNRGKNLYKNGNDKLVNYLVEYYEAHRLDQNPFILDKNRDEIASTLGVTVRTVNRGVRTLKESGLVGIFCGKMTISKRQYAALLEYREQIGKIK